MKACLVCLNAKYIHASPAPYVLLAGIRRYGERVTDAEILEGTVNEDEGAILERISAHRPDFVGFCCYIWNVDLVLRLCGRIRERMPDTRLCLGGPEVGYRAEQLLKDHPEIDCVISGEGERSLARLLDALACGAEPQGTCGLHYRRGEETVSVPEAEPEEEFLSPLDGGYADRLNGRIAYYESSRGCPFRCAFCLSGRCGRVRQYDAERAARDLARLAASGTRTVKLVDRTFNSDRARARRILEALIQRSGRDFPSDVTFHFELSGQLLDEETLRVIERAPIGLFQFEIGLQSTNADTLRAIGRSVDYERILSVTRRLVSFGNCHVHLDLIAGLPHETLASWEEGFERAYAARPHMLQLGFLKLLSGTELDERREEYGLVASSAPPYEILSTPTMTADALSALHAFEEAFDRLYNSGRHRRTLHYLTDTAGISPLSLFRRIGKSLKDSPASGLDALTERLLTLFSEHPRVVRDRLLDAMMTDRIATNQNTHLPPFLVRYDRRIAIDRARRRDKIPRGYASLSDGSLLSARYTKKNPVSGEYELETIQI